MSSAPELIVAVKALDEASAALKQLAQNAQGSLGQVESAGQKLDTQQKSTATSTKDMITGFSGVATSAFSLYMAYDKVETSTVALDRANLNVRRSTESLETAQKNYNVAVEKFGADSSQAKDAADKLSIAHDALQISTERAGLAQGNLTQSMVSGGLMVIPSLVTMISSLSSITQLQTAAQWLLNAAMSANPIGIIVIAIAGLIAVLVYLYTTCEPVRNAINAIGTALYSVGQTIYNTLKPAFDTIVGALTFLWNNVLSPIIGVFQTLWNLITNNPILSALFGPITMIAYLIQHWDEVTRTLSDVCTAIWNNVLKPIADFLNAVFTVAIKTIGVAITTLQGIWTALGNALTAIWNTVFKPIADFINAVFRVAVVAITSAITTLQGVWNALSGALTSVWNNVLRPIADFLRNVLGAAFSYVAGIAQGFGNVINTIMGWLKPLIDLLGGLGKALLGLCFAHAAPMAQVFNDTVLESIDRVDALSSGLMGLSGDLKDVAGVSPTIGLGVGGVGVGGGAVSRTIIIQSGAIQIGYIASDMDIRTLAEKLAKYTDQEERRQGLS